MAKPGESPPFPHRVGIWKGRDVPEGREFIRDRNYFTHWRAAADVERIPPKGARKRVVLLGESAARGLYYDPSYTPAGTLRAILDRTGASCEVVDLAITAIRPRQLGGLIRQLPAVQPDAVILFGGNNWHWEFDNDLVPAGDVAALAEVFAGGVDHYRGEACRRLIDGVAERMLGALAETTRGLGVPAVVVVPEFNLADWRDDVSPPLLKSGSLEEWHNLRVAAEGASARADWEAVAQLALRMKAIDRGLAPQAARLLALAARARGAAGEARLLFEEARDAAGGLPYWSCPRCLSSTQAILRSAEKRFGMAVVDLPRLLVEDGGIPGREHFMDYCHMTARGIGAAMRATAAAVTGVLSMQSSGPAAVELPEPDPGVAAAAHVLAAIHNAILNQPADVVLHHCSEGLRLDPGAGRLLSAFLCSRASEFPEWLNEGLVSACSHANARRHMIRTILAAEGRHYPHNLLELSGKVMPASWTVSTREAIAREIAPVLEARRLNLLDPRFQRASLHLRRCGYHVEKDRRTEFRFFRPAAGVLKIALCCRTPAAADPSEALRMAFGPTPIWSGPVGTAWKKIEISFENEAPTGGVGLLSLEWPRCSAGNAAAWSEAQDCLNRGEAPDVYPTCGEIHSLVLEW